MAADGYKIFGCCAIASRRIIKRDCPRRWEIASFVVILMLFAGVANSSP